MKDQTDQISLSKVSRQAQGFTLVEILIVLALIGIVAGLAMSNLGGIFGEGKVRPLKLGFAVPEKIT